MVIGQSFLMQTRTFGILETLTAILRDQVYFENNIVMD